MKTYILAFVLIVYVLLLSMDNDANFLIANIFLLAFIVFILIKYILTNKAFVRLSYSKLILLLLTFINLILNVNNITVSVLFVFVFIVMFLFFSDIYLNNYLNRNSLQFAILFVFIYSFIGLDFTLIFDPMYRFHGFTGTGTTFSTIILVLYVFVLYSTKSKSYVILCFGATLLLIIASQTRTSMVLFFVLNLLYLLKNRVNVKYLKFVFFLSFLLVLLAPIFSTVFSENSMSEIISRDENGVDQSIQSRNYLYYLQFIAINDMSFIEIIFGKGINTSLFLEGTIERSDPHNDFFRLFYDFGIFFFLIYLYILNKKIINHYSFSIVLIYMFSFYHNMVYSVFFILFLNFKIPISNDEN